MTVARIEHDIGKREARLGCLVTACAAPRDGVDARRQLLEIDRFHEVVVGAQVEQRDAVADPAACRQHEDRHRVARAAQPFDDLLPVTVGQCEVEQDGIVPPLRRERCPVFERLGAVDRKAALCQVRAQQVEERPVIFDR